jgi:hypothetical protein
MLNWLNRTHSSAAVVAGYPEPPLANWRNREQSGETRSRSAEPLRTVPRKRRLRLFELFTFVVVIALIVGIDLYIFGINKRLSALEGQFTEVKDWAFPASLLEGKYASLNARVRALTDAYSGLNEKLALIAAQPQPGSVAAGTAGEQAVSGSGASPVADSGAPGGTTLAMTETELPSEAPAAGIMGTAASSAPASAKNSGLVKRPEPETAAAPPVSGDTAQPAAESAGDAEGVRHIAKQEPAIPETPAQPADTQSAQASREAGPWVVNLLSDPSEARAARFADKARARGVTVEQNRSEVKGRVYWRVQIPGFATAGEARARAEEVKKRLNINDVWVFRQPG